VRYELSDYEQVSLNRCCRTNHAASPVRTTGASSRASSEPCDWRCVVARFSGQLRIRYDLLQSLRSLAAGSHLGSDHVLAVIAVKWALMASGHSCAMRSASAYVGAASRRRAGVRTSVPSSSTGKAQSPEVLRRARVHRRLAQGWLRALARRLHRSERLIDEDLFKNITHTFSTLQSGVDVHTFGFRECTRASSADR
jgi:hypothetical protein